jgi:NitT/TauT family transport system permease protein
VRSVKGFAGSLAGVLAKKAKPLLVVAAVIVAWEGYTVVRDVPSFILPAPSSIADYLVSNLGLLIGHAGITLREVAIAFFLSVFAGVALAILITRFKLLEEALLPILVTFQVIPTIAIAPLLVLWLGFGDAPKIAVAFLISFFPVLVNTLSGLRSMDDDLIYLARSLGATQWQVLRKISLPNALPFVFAGAKVSITLAVIGAVVGEFVGADQGLGFLILRGSAQLQTELLFASVIVLSLIGIGLFNLIKVLERVFLPWRTTEQLS